MDCLNKGQVSNLLIYKGQLSNLLISFRGNFNMDCFLWFDHIRSDSLSHRIRSDSVARSLVAIPPPASPPCPPPPSPSVSPALSVAALSASSVAVRLPHPRRLLLSLRPRTFSLPSPSPSVAPALSTSGTVGVSSPSASLPPPSSSYHAWHQVRGRHRQAAARPAASPPGRRRRGRWHGASHLSDTSTGKSGGAVKSSGPG
ncbi:hypothetical protein DAI22_12g036600 [Oryza sativa Japonica Group]|nr:hypothetical protein DAI22_12g036600 [Oryza sativa Japonica Group]